MVGSICQNGQVFGFWSKPVSVRYRGAKCSPVELVENRQRRRRTLPCRHPRMNSTTCPATTCSGRMTTGHAESSTTSKPHFSRGSPCTPEPCENPDLSGKNNGVGMVPPGPPWRKLCTLFFFAHFFFSPSLKNPSGRGQETKEKVRVPLLIRVFFVFRFVYL